MIVPPTTTDCGFATVEMVGLFGLLRVRERTGDVLVAGRPSKVAVGKRDRFLAYWSQLMFGESVTPAVTAVR